MFKKILPLTLLVSLFVSACGGSATPPVTLPAVAPATAATPALSLDTKTFRFTWTDVSDATHYKLQENTDGTSGFVQVGSDIAQNIQSVDHIVPLYARLNASYMLQSCNTVGCTDSSSISITGALVDAIGYVKASNPSNGGFFGYSVSLSSDGNTLAVGAVNEDGSSAGINGTQDDLLSDAGAVYVFTRSGTTWTQQAYVKASNPSARDLFGSSVSLSSDGNTLAVGSVNEDGSGTNAGAAYVFTRSGTTWTEQAYVRASNPSASDFFGQSVSLSSDGNTLAVGSYQEDGMGSNAGAAYVFTRSGTTWTEQAYVKASNPSADDLFGSSVSLSSDGNTLAVGSVWEDGSSAGINGTKNDLLSAAGAVYVFTRSGTTWAQEAYVKASNTSIFDYFGSSVSLSSDGNTLAVGSSEEDGSSAGINGAQDDLLSDAGAVYVFTRSGTTWTQQAYVKASNPSANDLFGQSVSLSSDGNTLAVSSRQEGGNSAGINGTKNDLLSDAGAVYVFTRSGTTWAQQAYVKASNPSASDLFGYSVSLSSDGNTLAVGPVNEDGSSAGINGTQDDSLSNAGAVYIY